MCLFFSYNIKLNLKEKNQHFSFGTLTVNSLLHAHNGNTKYLRIDEDLLNLYLCIKLLSYHSKSYNIFYPFSIVISI